MKATRFIQNVTPIQPAKQKDKRKAELSQPGKYDKNVMKNTKDVYTGRGTL